MLKDSADKSFEFVIVYKLDRFARNRYDSAINKATLKKNGVKVLSACEQITDTPEGIILESMIEGFEHTNGHNKFKIELKQPKFNVKQKPRNHYGISVFCVVLSLIEHTQYLKNG